MSKEIPHILSLINGCCKNERDSQRDLYHLLYDYAMKITYRYVTLSVEAEELTNESFMKLFKNMQQFDVNRQGETEALLKGWFKKIIINTCIDFLRKHHLNVISLETHNGGNDNFIDVQESGFDKIQYREIIEIIKKLTPVYRTVFNLYVMEGYSHEEIANMLKISIGASKSNLSKARHNLRKMITQQTEFNKQAYV